MHISYWREIKSKTTGRIGILLLILILSMAILGPMVVPYDPAQQTKDSFQPPSLDHLLGTNDVGQDILSRLVYGSRTSLLIAVSAGLISTLISTVVGTISGLSNGMIDKIMMRLVDAMLVIPPIIVIIIVAAYMQPGVGLIIILISILTWPGGARVIRAQTLTLKERTHVIAARTFGAGPFHIILRHILPDLGPILTANFIQGARRAIFMEAGLSFLGVTNPTIISWGKMLYHSLKYVYLDVWQWWLLPVGTALSITIMAFSFLGVALEETMDPRLRRR